MTESVDFVTKKRHEIGGSVGRRTVYKKGPMTVAERQRRRRRKLARAKAGRSSHDYNQTLVHGNNADLIEVVSNLYLKRKDRLLDLTYGRGVFWRRVDLELYDFDFIDIAMAPPHWGDFRAVDRTSDNFNVIVFDPPYMHNPGLPIVNDRYRNSESHGRATGHDGIIADYSAGMTEGYRLLKNGGLLWVKTQDEIQSGKQRWSHIEVHGIALRLGLIAEDLFVLAPKSTTPPQRHVTQVHAKKAHSYLWVFKKPAVQQSRRSSLHMRPPEPREDEQAHPRARGRGRLSGPTWS